jgi:aspartate/methionine/tyrosine aminotransferase
MSAHGGDVVATERLWCEAGVRVVPGSYLARVDAEGRNPGTGYIRVAMVQDRETTAEALHRMVDLFHPTGSD